MSDSDNISQTAINPGKKKRHFLYVLIGLAVIGIYYAKSSDFFGNQLKSKIRVAIGAIVPNSSGIDIEYVLHPIPGKIFIPTIPDSSIPDKWNGYTITYPLECLESYAVGATVINEFGGKEQNKFLVMMKDGEACGAAEIDKMAWRNLGDPYYFIAEFPGCRCN